MPNDDWTTAQTDDEYFERMTHALFQAGLNWKMIETKWPNFKKAFANFSIKKVAKFDDTDIDRLMHDQGIVRNGRKVLSTIENAKEFLKVVKEFGSFRAYLQSFKRNEDALQGDLQSRFHHFGESSSRTFLWMSGVKLTPTPEEKAWLAQNKK